MSDQLDHAAIDKAIRDEQPWTELGDAAFLAMLAEVGRQLAEKIKGSTPTKYPEVGTVYVDIANDVLGWTGADHD